jgi:hypothetical protein
LKSFGNIVKFSLLGIWIIAVGILISLGINEATQIAFDGKTVKKETINIAQTDTLIIKFKNNDFYSKSSNDHTDFKLTQDEKNNEIIYSNNVTIEIMKTEESLPYIQIERLAVGKSANEARNRAEKIKYGYKIEGNQLILDNYLLTNTANKFRGQKVELFLYLPKGTLFKADENMQIYDDSENDFFNLHFSSSDYIYKVEDSRVKCLNCPADENEYNDVENGTTEVITNENDSTDVVTVKVNGKTIIETKSEITKTGKLTVGENGVIIKTN